MSCQFPFVRSKAQQPFYQTARLASSLSSSFGTLAAGNASEGFEGRSVPSRERTQKVDYNRLRSSERWVERFARALNEGSGSVSFATSYW